MDKVPKNMSSQSDSQSTGVEGDMTKTAKIIERKIRTTKTSYTESIDRE